MNAHDNKTMTVPLAMATMPEARETGAPRRFYQWLRERTDTMLDFVIVVCFAGTLGALGGFW